MCQPARFKVTLGDHRFESQSNQHTFTDLIVNMAVTYFSSSGRVLELEAWICYVCFLLLAEGLQYWEVFPFWLQLIAKVRLLNLRYIRRTQPQVLCCRRDSNC